MPRALPALRRNLDVMPSPVPERPGVLLRDPFRYTEDVLIVPPPLVPFLRYFDGGHDERDLHAALHRATESLEAGAICTRSSPRSPWPPAACYVTSNGISMRTAW
jgi:hypothetical protein